MASNLPSPAAPAIVSPTLVSRDLSLLHPLLREPLGEVIRQLAIESIPFRPFEAYRTPARQAYLYAQGRTRPGSIVTKSQPWSSLHQYGLGVDMVLWVDEKWSWDDHGPLQDWWDRLYELAHQFGLDPLSFEKPHLQVHGITLSDLRVGSFPGGGDDSWWNNLKSNIASWRTTPPAPKLHT